MLKLTEFVVPDAGTLPVPVQPVQTYCVPEGPATGEGTLALIGVPALNQPLTGLGDPYGEVTVK